VPIFFGAFKIFNKLLVTTVTIVTAHTAAVRGSFSCVTLVCARWRSFIGLGFLQSRRVYIPKSQRHLDWFSRFRMANGRDQCMHNATSREICSNSPHLCTECMRCGL